MRASASARLRSGPARATAAAPSVRIPAVLFVPVLLVILGCRTVGLTGLARAHRLGLRSAGLRLSRVALLGLSLSACASTAALLIGPALFTLLALLAGTVSALFLATVALSTLRLSALACATLSLTPFARIALTRASGTSPFLGGPAFAIRFLLARRVLTRLFYTALLSLLGLVRSTFFVAFVCQLSCLLAGWNVDCRKHSAADSPRQRAEIKRCAVPRERTARASEAMQLRALNELQSRCFQSYAGNSRTANT